MAAKVVRNGQSELASALAQLLRNQSVFVSHLDEDRLRFSRIERKLDEITALLTKHVEILKQHDRRLAHAEQVLQDLPAAIQKKIGFQKS